MEMTNEITNEKAEGYSADSNKPMELTDDEIGSVAGGSNCDCGCDTKDKKDGEKEVCPHGHLH